MASASVSSTTFVNSTPLSRRYFITAAVLVALIAFWLAGWVPLGFSILTVFLFAGPHNWMEARYFMERMPARWGRLKPYFLSGLAGVVLLVGSFAALPWLAAWGKWSNESWLFTMAAWNSCLIGWVLGLVAMRVRQNPKRQWAWVYPLGLGLIGITWLYPMEWSLLLVYAHPLVALWFLDRELLRLRPSWRRGYHGCLLLVAGLLVLLWCRLAWMPSLPGEDGLTMRITRHAGSHILQGVSSHLLVATHTFLEMLHYGVWLVAIPALTLRSKPWQLRSVPLARRSSTWQWVLLAVLTLGGFVVLGFWASFLADYPATRDFYFTVAMVHVLAEVPFLLRAL